MKNFNIILFISLIFFSCEKKYDTLTDSKGNKIVQLVKLNNEKEKDLNGNIFENKKAYLINYIRWDKEELMRIAEKVAKYYNIEDYEMYFILPTLKDEVLNSEQPSDYLTDCIVPYEYRKEYNNANKNIHSKVLERDGYSGSIYTHIRYHDKDSLLLIDIMDSLGISFAQFYDKKIENPKLIDCYATYSPIKKFLFIENIHQGDFFSIDSVNVIKAVDKPLAVKFFTNKYLTKEQILRLKRNNNIGDDKNIYFYLYNDWDKEDYASIHYFNGTNEYVIYMFNEKKTYTYNVSKDEWTFYNHKE